MPYRPEEAYYLGWCYPPEPETAYGSVSIQREDGSREELYKEFETRTPVWKLRKHIPKERLLKVMVEHLTGKKAPRWLINRLLEVPGHSYMRVTTKDLKNLIIQCKARQLSLFKTK